jgi:hypothetical protein
MSKKECADPVTCRADEVAGVSTFGTLGLALWLAMTLGLGHAEGACNLQAAARASFDGAQGSLNRPFAAPGEMLEVGLRSCDASAGFTSNPLDHTVTILFSPPGGPRTAVVLTTDATCTNVDSELAVCEADLGGGGHAFCVPADEAVLAVVDRGGKRSIAFRFPDTDARCTGGTDAGAPCRQHSDCQGGLCDPDDDDRTLSGPAMVIVTSRSAPLPCALSRCAEASGTLACIDSLYQGSGTCSTAVVNATFPSFTALTPPNNFSTECTETEPPCMPVLAEEELRLSLDAHGNVLAPFVWDGIREQLDGEPVARIVRGTLAFPVTPPGQSFVASYSPEGRKLAPVFEPKESGGDALTLFGSADAPYTILRVARGSDVGRQCNGGANGGQPCNVADECLGGTCAQSVCAGGSSSGSPCRSDSECPGGGLCGPKLFDFSVLAVDDGTGPAILPRSADGAFGICHDDVGVECTSNCGPGGPCVTYKLEAGVTVPLDSLVPRDEIGELTATERIDGIDLNKDGDGLDVVMTLRDAATGALLELGPPPAACDIPADFSDPVVLGRAVVRTSRAPLLLPAGAKEGNVLAFLESESGQGGCDLNGDGDSEDGILRVFDGDGNELTGAMNVGVDANPVVNDRSLAVSNGLVFYRSSEAQRAKRITIRANTTGTGGQAVGGSSFAAYVSTKGRYVTFLSNATNLFSPPPTRQGVYIKDLVNGTIARVNDNSNQDDPNANATGVAATSNNSDTPIVVFESVASNIDPTDPPPLLQTFPDVFRVVGQSGTPTRISRPNNTALQPDAGSFDASPSRLGTAFTSLATNLLSTIDANGSPDVYFKPINLPIIRISDTLGGVQGNGTSENPSMARDVLVIAFESTSTNLVTPDGIVRDVFVWDDTGPSTVLERASTGPGGVRGNSTSREPTISADGRFVGFESLASNLVVGDTNGVQDVFVRDRLLGVTERVSVATGGEPANGASENLAMSDDGRYVLFASAATNLVANDLNGNIDLFLHDRITRSTARVNVDSLNQETMGGVGNGDVADVGMVVFASSGDDLVPGDTNTVTDVFARLPDPADPLGIDALLEPNGALVDVVLQVFDAANPGPPQTIAPAEAVKVSNGKALFVEYLPSNFAGIVPTFRFWDSDDGSLTTLGFTAHTDIPFSDTMAFTAQTIAALDGENDLFGSPGESDDINGDDGGDAGDDGYLIVRDVCSPITSCSWSIPVGAGGHALVASEEVEQPLAANGAIVGLIVAESEHGPTATNLNAASGDGDTNDGVLHIYDAADASVTNLQAAVLDFVIGDRVSPPACDGDVQLVAFRVSEAAQGNTNLNGSEHDDGFPPDLDTNDAVLHVYDTVSRGPVVNTGQAALACRFAACDPRTPYRVEGSRVNFLTRESDQGAGFGQDINGDGDANDIILHQYDFCTGALTPLAAVSPEGHTDPTRRVDESHVLQVEAGRCDEGACGVGDTCAEGAYCERDVCLTAFQICSRHKSIACSSNADCKRCILRVPGVCDNDDDCPSNATCETQLVTTVVSGSDRDGDGIPDDLDGCPDVSDPLGNDSDGDGVPDACDLRSCASLPLFGCRAPGADKSSLVLTDNVSDKKDKLVWKWGKGDAVTKAEFGNPATSDSYELCMYDASGVVASALIPPGGNCAGGKPCWKEANSGFKYKNKAATPLGISGLAFKEGTVAGKAKLTVKAGGELLDMPSLPDLDAPLIVQLVNNTTGVCFDAGFSEPFRKRTDTQLKAKGGMATVTTTTLPPPCPDADFDTFQDATCGGTDCMDSNFDVRPNQTTFFPSHRGDGSFDYNCDTVQERRWQTTQCFVSVANLCLLSGGQQGYLAATNCGQSGTFVTGCTGGAANCTNVTEQRVQECR